MDECAEDLPGSALPDWPGVRGRKGVVADPSACRLEQQLSGAQLLRSTTLPSAAYPSIGCSS